MVAVSSRRFAVVDSGGGKVNYPPGNAETIPGGIQICAVYFWHSGGSTVRDEARMEAVMINTRSTPQPWFSACGANVGPKFLCARKMVQ